MIIAASALGDDGDKETVCVLRVDKPVPAGSKVS